jgi:hypothetical protein
MSVNRKISNLPEVFGASSLDTDILPLVASGVTSRIKVSELRIKLGFNIPAGGRTVTDPATYLANNAVFNVKDFGAFGDGSHNDTSAIQAAINAAGSASVYFPKGTYNVNTTLVISAAGQVLVGEGDLSIISSTAATITISGNSKAYIGVYKMKISTTGTIGIDLPISTHFHAINAVHIVGATTAAIQATSAYYGEISHCDLETNEIGLLGTDYNGNHVHSNAIRQNHVGIKLVWSSAGTIISGNTIESARAGSTYAIWLLSASSVIVQGNRMEYTVGTVHILIDYDGTHVAQFNQLIGNVFEGTIASITLGDGAGTDQILGTFIVGGRGAAVTINSDATDTVATLEGGAFPSVPTDNGSQTYLTREGNLSWSAGITGLTTNPTATFKYARRGDEAIIWIQQLTGTSNTTACTLTGLPALITPKANTQTMLAPIFDNGVLAVGAVAISTGGVITLSKGLGGAGNDFTAAGAKGISPIVLVYKIN